MTHRDGNTCQLFAIATIVEPKEALVSANDKVNDEPEGKTDEIGPVMIESPQAVAALVAAAPVLPTAPAPAPLEIVKESAVVNAVITVPLDIAHVVAEAADIITAKEDSSIKAVVATSETAAPVKAEAAAEKAGALFDMGDGGAASGVARRAATPAEKAALSWSKTLESPGGGSKPHHHLSSPRATSLKRGNSEG